MNLITYLSCLQGPEFMLQLYVVLEDDVYLVVLTNQKLWIDASPLLGRLSLGGVVCAANNIVLPRHCDAWDREAIEHAP